MRGRLYDFVTSIIKKELPPIVKKSVQDAVGKKMYTTSDVREKYGLSATQQHRLRKKGKVTYVQDGGTILYPRESIERYIAEYTVPGNY